MGAPVGSAVVSNPNVAMAGNGDVRSARDNYDSAWQAYSASRSGQ